MDTEKLEQNAKTEVKLERLFQGQSSTAEWRWHLDLSVNSALRGAEKNLERREEQIFKSIPDKVKGNALMCRCLIEIESI